MLYGGYGPTFPGYPYCRLYGPCGMPLYATGAGPRPPGSAYFASVGPFRVCSTVVGSGSHSRRPVERGPSHVVATVLRRQQVASHAREPLRARVLDFPPGLLRSTSAVPCLVFRTWRSSIRPFAAHHGCPFGFFSRTPLVRLAHVLRAAVHAAARRRWLHRRFAPPTPFFLNSSLNCRDRWPTSPRPPSDPSDHVDAIT